jgi:hypothetical protein
MKAVRTEKKSNAPTIAIKAVWGLPLAEGHEN